MPVCRGTWRGSYEVWVMPSYWLLEQAMKVIGRVLELGRVVGGWLSDTMMKSRLPVMIVTIVTRRYKSSYFNSLASPRGIQQC